MQDAFNQMMEFNKLDIIIVIIAVVQLLTGFVQGYKKTLYHSVKYILAYLITRGIYKAFMPALFASGWYEGYQSWIQGALENILPTNFALITLYPVDRYILNILLFISILIFLRLVIIGWAPEVSLFDRFAGLFIGIIKVVIITTILVLLLNPFIEMLEPILGNNMIEESQIVNYMKNFNPLLNGSQIEF